ncbi:MAG: hypothetical protein RL701_6091, partial [Pseudomonadota bacterium]
REERAGSVSVTIEPYSIEHVAT